MAPGPAASSSSNNSSSSNSNSSGPPISSEEVNLLVYTYLAESTFTHSAYALWNEGRLNDYVHAAEGDSQPRIPQTGQLITILKKGLLYLQAEAKHRGVSEREVTQFDASRPARLTFLLTAGRPG